MKKNKLAVFGLLTLLTVVCVSCGTAPAGTETVTKQELKIPTLHEVTITERPDRVFTYSQGGVRKTDYQIVYDGNDAFVAKCAIFLSKQLFSASGADFNPISYLDFVKAGKSITSSSKFIIVGCNDLFEQYLTYPEKCKATAAYYLKNYRHNFFIRGFDTYGYQEAVLAFARYTVDYDMIEEDTVVFENKNIDTLPDMEVLEKPDYQGNTPTNNFTMDKRFGIGFDMTYPFMLTSREDGTIGRNWHNVFDFAPTETYLQTHPKWYSEGSPTQICYSCRGDKNEYDAMVNQFVKVGLKTLADNQDKNVLNITSNDIGDACGCEECTRLKAQDGSSSGQVIRFMNDVNSKIQVEMKKQNRIAYTLFFAYLGYQAAPTKTVEQDPTLKCQDEVMVCIAPLHANYTKTFYDDVNEIYANQFRDWSKYNSNIVAWLYETNYHHYMYPYSTYSTMMDDYRFCREQGAKLMLNEGQRKSANVTCFGHLKEYLCSKAQFDIYSNYNDYCDKFFRSYYLDAADIMREYYEQMIAWETKLEQDPNTGLGGGVYEEIGSKASYWPKQLLLNWLGMMDDAAKAVAKYEVVDSSLYKKLIKHINIERLFPMFALCDLHANSYTSEDILALRKEFKALGDELGLIEFAEHYGDITEYKYKVWGID